MIRNFTKKSVLLIDIVRKNNVYQAYARCTFHTDAQRQQIVKHYVLSFQH